MPTLYDRVKFATTTTGTGQITVGSAASGFATPAGASVPNGARVRYVIEDGTAWEIGTGIYTSSGTTMTRVLTRSSTGSLLSLSGAASVFLSISADDLNVSIGAIRFGLTSPGSDWVLADGSAYLKSAYPEAATAIGSIVDFSQSVYRSNWNTDNYQKVVFANSLFVAVGDVGACATSTDGVSWTLRTTGTQANLTGLIYANSLWVAFGSNGAIITSSDAITWTVRTSQFTSAQAVRQLVYLNSVFVAVGDGGVLSTSTNGTTWTTRTSGVSTQLNDVFFGNSVWVIAGAAGVILTASDPTSTWTSRTNPLGTSVNMSSVVYGASIWVMCAESGTSTISAPDPTTTWTTRTGATTGVVGQQVIFANSTFFLRNPTGASNTNNAAYSANGTTWTTFGSSSPGAGLSDLQYLNSQWVGVLGLSKTLAGVIKPGVDVSPATITTSSFVNYYTSAGFNGRSVAYGASTYVIVGINGTFMSSSNGTTWTNNSKGTNQALVGVAYGASTYVAVGTAGAVITSTDLATWTARSSGSVLNFLAIEFGNSLFVAVGVSGLVMTSADGITWTSRTSNVTVSLAKVIYANSLWVAIGTSGTVITSTDAITWTVRTTPTVGNLVSIAYGAGKFVAVTATSVIYSTDGLSWSLVLLGMNNAVSIAYGNGYFLISVTTGFVRSSDGVTWSFLTSPAQNNNLIFTGTGFTALATGNRLYTLDGSRVVWTEFLFTGGSTPFVANGVVMLFGNSGYIQTFTEFSYNTSTQFVVPRIVSPGPSDEPIKAYVKVLA